MISEVFVDITSFIIGISFLNTVICLDSSTYICMPIMVR